MKIAKRMLINRLIMLLLLGAGSFLLQLGTDNDPDMAVFLTELFLYGVYSIVALAEEFRGRLKISPIYKASYEEALDVKPVQILLAVYLAIISLLVFNAIYTHGTIPFISEKPLLLYLVVSPFLLFIILGKYVVEKTENES